MRRIFGHISSVPDGISATSDKMFRQRAEIRELRKRMQQHNAVNPQQQVTIRYIKIVSTLMDTTEPRPHRPPCGPDASSSRHHPVPGVSSASTSAIRSNSHRGFEYVKGIRYLFT